MKSAFVLLSVAVGAMLFAGCGQGKKEQAAESERVAQMGDKAEALVDSGRLYSAEKLQALLPKSLPNMKPFSKPEAKKSGSIGKRVSIATVSFEGGNGEFVDLTITDASGPKGLAAVKDSEWTTKDVHEDTDARLVMVEKKNGRRLYKEVNMTPKRCIARLLIGDRFIVEADGTEMDYPAVEAFLDKVQLETLEKMAASR